MCPPPKLGAHQQYRNLRADDSREQKEEVVFPIGKEREREEEAMVVVVVVARDCSINGADANQWGQGQWQETYWKTKWPA